MFQLDAISSFNYEHHYRSKVILAVVLKGKSHICWSHVLSSIFGCILFCFHNFGWSSFLRSSLFFLVSPFWGFLLFLSDLPFWDSFIIGKSSVVRSKQCKAASNQVIQVHTGPNRVIRGQTRQNVTKCGQMGLKGAKQGQTGPNGAKRGQTKPNWAK